MKVESKQTMKIFIERKRKTMVQAAKNHGMSAEITLKHSQELDELLNQYALVSQTKNKKICCCT